MNIDPLKCPKCGNEFDAKEMLNEVDIFSTPLRLECDKCKTILKVQAEAVCVAWNISKEESADEAG